MLRSVNSMRIQNGFQFCSKYSTVPAVQYTVAYVSVADPHHLNADPDPASHFDADPDPTVHSDTGAGPDPTCRFDADPDPTTHFSPDLDPPMHQNGPLRLPPFHFDANADRIQLSTSMRSGSGSSFPK